MVAVQGFRLSSLVGRSVAVRGNFLLKLEVYVYYLTIYLCVVIRLLFIFFIFMDIYVSLAMFTSVFSKVHDHFKRGVHKQRMVQSS